MKRRDFLTASCVGGLAPLAGAASRAAAADAGEKDLYELRLYQVETAEKSKVLEDFLRDAAIPALNRLGIQPVGVFKLLPEGQDKGKTLPAGGNDFYVLLPHKSMESVTTAAAKLMKDAEFLKAGSAVLEAPMKNPVYKRIESSLMLAFDEAPKLGATDATQARIFQLRIYESHNELKARKKIEMFNAGGEIALFRQCGMPPVFFGETLAGSRVPNLTYMLVFADEAARQAAWKKFMDAPEWDKLKKDPQYKDTVSNITNMLLAPAACSQV